MRAISLSFTFTPIDSDLLNNNSHKKAAEWKRRSDLREFEHLAPNFKGIDGCVQWKKTRIEMF